jgi:hypothetical protein
VRILVSKTTKEFNASVLLLSIPLVAALIYTYQFQNTSMFYVGVVTIALLIVTLTLSSVRNELVLRIDETGIYDRGLGVGKILWQDISDVQLQMSGEGRFLSFKLKNPEFYLRRLRGSRRKTALFHRYLGLNRFNVYIGHVNLDPVDLKRFADNRIISHSLMNFTIPLRTRRS